jgi:hypothetical protein
MRARAAIISLREKRVDETGINDLIQAAMDAGWRGTVNLLNSQEQINPRRERWETRRIVVENSRTTAFKAG